MNPYGTRRVREDEYMAQQLGRIPGSVPCTSSVACSATNSRALRPRDCRTGAQLNSWCNRRATSSSVSGTGSSLPASSLDPGSDPPLFCGRAGFEGDGLTLDGFGVRGFCRPVPAPALFGLGLSHRSDPSPDVCIRANRVGDCGLNFSESSIFLPHGKPVANAAAAARLLVEAYGDVYAPSLPSPAPFSFLDSGDPCPCWGSIFGPSSFVFRLGYRFTADADGSGGVAQPGTSVSVFTDTPGPGAFSPSHCFSLRLSMVSGRTRS
mmetsp:Transcript_8960/g.33439  ORF Transcript_8960/g.33439 Transcript_8960/m.33439 type:complete len:265 (+) Transcript_8960:3046-3840(+)